MKRIISWMGRLSILALVVGFAGVASAQTMGSTLVNFNILSKTAITLTGRAALILNVPVVGTSPGNSLTLTDATVGVYHDADTTATTGQAEAAALDASLTAAGGTVVALGGTLPAVLNVGPGITTVGPSAAAVANTNTSLTITGSASSVVIFRVATTLTLVDADIILAGGILPSNIYWQVLEDVAVTNNDAATRTFPGTVVTRTATKNITVTIAGAGSLQVGRLISQGGSVTATSAGGAGTLTIALPSGGVVGPGPEVLCKGKDLIIPSPTTGPTAKFAYCMDQPGTVKIRVYNAIGDIASKIEDSKAAGVQNSPLNTARLAPGVYFYFLEKNYNDGSNFHGGLKKFVVVH